MRKRNSARRAAHFAAAMGIVTSLFVPCSQALAHAVVFPKSAKPGAYEKYAIRVPNEKKTATTKVQIRFPEGLRVVSFGEVAGWQLLEERNSAGAITGATWTGELAPERFVEFPFVAVNPASETELVWPVFQTYSDGERVDWTGTKDSKQPASVTSIEKSGEGGGGSLPVTAAAILISFVALGVALRPRRTGQG